uniref:6-methylsalicylic acid synthase (6-MSAS) ) n=1 Tax=Ganoderma boninense TaxID=34458 RepID=A0A5K1JRB3_9APHY|nr:6-methylsalicylic acid synthase (6-MSAS) (EC (Arthrosporol biosynthesis cluster protein AOL_s00215g283) [Ganoderma boninense]
MAVGTWSVNINPIFAALITVFSQMFFIGRIYISTPISVRDPYVPYHLKPGSSPVQDLIILSCAVLLALAIYTADSLNGVRDDVMQEKRLIETSLALPAIVDTFLSLTLIYVIHRSRASLKRTNTWLTTHRTIGRILNWGAFISFIAVKNPFTSEQYGAITIVAARVYAITFLCVSTKTSEAIFDGGSYGLKVIERTNRRAAAERWNVPHIPEEPASINISVTRELEEGGDWDGPRKHHGETSSTDLDSTF